MKTTIAAILLTAATGTASAITIDESKFFAYVRQPYSGFHVMLSHRPCHLKNSGFAGYAEQVPPHRSTVWPSCWKRDEDNSNVIVICAIIDNREVGACQLISQDYFRDVASLPRSAF